MTTGLPDYDISAGSSSAAVLAQLTAIAGGVAGISGGTVKRIAAPIPHTRIITYTVPAGFQWEVLGGFFQYSADGTVGNRVIVYEIDDDGGSRVFNTVMDGHQVQTTTESYELVRGNIYVPPTPGIALDHLLGLPVGARMGAAWELTLRDTMAIAVGDVFVGSLWVLESAV